MNPETLATLEWVAASFGVINIALLIWRTVWNYPFGMIMVALYIFVFWEKRLYAEAGLWYDALSSLSDLIEATPDNPGLRQQRAALLKQVGLTDAAASDVVTQ